MDVSCAAVVFDSDGVLVDSHADGRRAWSQLANEFDFALDEGTWSQLAGVRPADSLRRFVAADRLAEAVDRLENLEVGYAAATHDLPGARRLTSGIAASSISGRWAIATSASRRLGEARWAGAGIPVPDVVIAAEDVELGKPHPDPYLAAALALGVQASDCVVFEDSPLGAEAGRKAGATVVAVGSQEWAFTPAFRIASLADVVISSARQDRVRIHFTA